MRVPVRPPLEMDSGRGPGMPASKFIANQRKSGTISRKKFERETASVPSLGCEFGTKKSAWQKALSTGDSAFADGPIRTDPNLAPVAVLPATAAEVRQVGYSNSVRHVDRKTKAPNSIA